MTEVLFNNHFTHYAPAERLGTQSILDQSQAVAKLEDVRFVFDQFPSVILILNQQRQIVYCNQALLDLLKIDNCKQILGARTGEVLGCIHAVENEAGCGTAESCRTCGAALATLTSLAGQKTSRECRVTVKRELGQSCLDLRLSATPFTLEGHNFTTLFVTDISHEKRRMALERIFFHDILNTAGSLRGFVELLGSIKDPVKAKEMLKDIEEVSISLIDEILEQRDLVNAENNELKVQPASVDSLELVTKVFTQFVKHPLAERVNLKLADRIDNVAFISDPVLLKRVLNNMVKNALEASGAGETVTIGVQKKEQQIEFWVNNPAVISRDIQLQIFQRSFSTKGKGRGLGTYSMKLLTERYLKGTVAFTVKKPEGTTFFARYPLILEN